MPHFFFTYGDAIETKVKNKKAIVKIPDQKISGKPNSIE